MSSGGNDLREPEQTIEHSALYRVERQGAHLYAAS